MTTKYRYVPRVPHKYIGAYAPKIDALDKALGRVKYFDDLTIEAAVPRMLYMAILASPHANGRIVSMDTSEAEAMSGVRAVLRYDDPEVRALKPTTHSWADTAITPYRRETVPRWWDRRVLADNAKFVGDQIGVAVAADTRGIAEEALRKIRIEWETSPAFLETDEAAHPDVRILHPEADPASNQLPHRLDLEAVSRSVDDITLDIGDVDAALASADHIVETDMTFGGNSTQATLDFRGVMVSWAGGRVEVWTTHYFSDQVRMHLSEMLDLPLKDVRVHNTNCGAQMGKYNTGEHTFFIVCALLAKRTGCPVKYKMSVREEFAEQRTMINFKIRSGINDDGVICGWDWDGTANNGAYTGVTGYALTSFLAAEGLNRLFAPIKNMRMRSRVFFTNRIPGGVMRSIGNVQPNWAVMQAVDEMAEVIGMDPLDIIKKNFGNAYDPQPNLSLAAVIDAGAEEIGWNNRHRAGEGPLIDGVRRRGMGMSVHNQWHAEWQENERGRVEVSIRVNPDLTVILNAPTKETGAGGNSAVVFACAENLSFIGVSPADIRWIAEGDTELGLRDVPPTDSVVSFLLAEAVVGAAESVRRQFLERAARMLSVGSETQWVRDADAETVGANASASSASSEGGADGGRAGAGRYTADDLDIDEGRIFAKEDPGVTLIEAKDLMYDDDCVPITGYNIRLNNKTVTGMGYGAWFAEVEVDTETGKTEVLRVVIANDAGQVMHASGAESQQIGGVSSIGVGEALSEEFHYDKKTGVLLNNNYLDYKLQTIMDVPEVDPLLIECWKGAGTYGAGGLSESTPTGVAAAIANAFYNATGVRVSSVPLSPRKVLEALDKGPARRGDGRGGAR
jgi:xanthine dehydrogenase molybdenum-binding subunit